MKLCIISIEVVLKGVGFNDVRERRRVEIEENRAKNRSLWNTTSQKYRHRMSAVDEDCLFSV